MDVKELRIGNLVCYNGEVAKVKQITKHKIGYHTKPYEMGMNYARLCEIEPILITEELLLKCGFDEPCDGVYEHNYEEFEVTKEVENWWVTWNGGSDFWFRIKHIHQLQNAYYLVTGKELEIKV